MPNNRFSSNASAGQAASSAQSTRLEVVAPSKREPTPDGLWILRLRQFSNKYCTVLGSGSMLKTGTYYAHRVIVPEGGGAVTMATTSSSRPGSVTVRVHQVAADSRAESVGPVSAAGRMIPSDGSVKLAELPLQVPLRFDGTDGLAFRINGRSFHFTQDDTLSALLDTVSQDLEAMVSMSYDAERDRFVVLADGGGKSSVVEIDNLAGNAFGPDSAFGIGEGVYRNGRNTEAEINGLLTQCKGRELYTPGLVYYFNSVTGEAGETYTITRDYDATICSIRQFMAELFELVTDLEEAGGALNQLAAEMREALGPREGFTLKSMGVTAGEPDDPKPILDTDRLRLCLKLNTEDVMNLFAGSGEGMPLGVVHRIKECIGRVLSSWKVSEPAPMALEPVPAESQDEALARYGQLYSQMRTAVLMMEHQKKIITKLFEK